MSGEYSSIHRQSGSSPKCRVPPQLVGDLSGGAWCTQIHRTLRFAESAASWVATRSRVSGPSHHGQIVKSVSPKAKD